MERENKLLTLFFSSKNRFWEPILGQKPKMGAIAEASGFELSPIYNYRNCGHIDNGSFPHLMAELARYIDSLPTEKNPRRISRLERTQLKQTLADFKTAYYDKNVKFYKVAELLGYEIDDAQKIIDEAIYNKWSVLRRACLPKSLARDVASRYKGIYLLYMMRKKHIFQCTLRVRYDLPISSHSSIIRCKLNVPNTGFALGTTHTGHWQYDGFLVEREASNYWCFELRDSNRPDFIYIISDHFSRFKESRVMGGQYLTTAQDKQETIISDAVRFKYIGEPDWHAMNAFMDGECRLLDRDEDIGIWEDAGGGLFTR